jgi:hypothetical protein
MQQMMPREPATGSDETSAGDPACEDGSPAQDLLSRWLGLAGIQQRCLKAWAAEIDAANSLVEDGTLALAGQFRAQRIRALQQCDRVRSALAGQSRNPAAPAGEAELTATLTELMTGCEEWAAAAHQAVTALQFQDAARQRLEAVLDSMTVVGFGVADVEKRSLEHFPALAARLPDGWPESLIHQVRLTAVRQRFAERVLSGSALDSAGSLDGGIQNGGCKIPADDDVELF